MTFSEWWVKESGWHTEGYDSEGLAEWCLAKAAWEAQQSRIDELEQRLIADQTQGQTYRTLLLIALREYVEIPEDILHCENADEEAIAWFSEDTTNE